jgi:hypothetical protein
VQNTSNKIFFFTDTRKYFMLLDIRLCFKSFASFSHQKAHFYFTGPPQKFSLIQGFYRYRVSKPRLWSKDEPLPSPVPAVLAVVLIT